MYGSGKCESDDLLCLATSSAPPYTGRVDRDDMHASGARRGFVDKKQTGIQGFSVQPRFTVVNDGSVVARDQYDSQLDLRDVECTDCSTVDQATFMEKCVTDKNVGVALLRFSQCNLKANRHVNLDAGSRQIESVGERDGASHNLTNADNVDSSRGTNSAPGAGAMYAYGSSTSDPTLGDVLPATRTKGGYSIGPAMY